MPTAVGIHVFAGGFTLGVQAAGFNVECQLESHNFGRESVEALCKIPFVNHQDGPKAWPKMTGQFAFGNPRCTGFSTITGGYDEQAHGAWSKPTQDIHQFCEYAAGKFDIAVWESVQPTFTTGRSLLDYLRDKIFKPKRYRIAHIMLNAASFGNQQMRKRYFFVAYRDDRNFNVTPPEIPLYAPTAYDAIWHLRNRPTREAHLFSNHDLSYDFDSYHKLTDEEKLMVPYLPNGWNQNLLARYKLSALPERLQDKYHFRTSEMPFSMHCIYRMNWLTPHPTIHSSAVRFIHPEHNRPLTVGELATAMGWPPGMIPSGPRPVSQLAKGIVPAVGTWLAEQVERYLDNAWGEEDWQSSYDQYSGEWVGEANCNGAVEKIFNLSSYVSTYFDRERYSDVNPIQMHRHDVARGPNRSPQYRQRTE